MSTSLNPFQPAIDALEKDAADLERQWYALVSAINVLRDKAGLPPRPTGGMPGTAAGGENGASPGKVTIAHDTFFGKRMGTAAREYLEMRKAAGDGPAKPRDIFDAMKAGGFQFETKDDSVAMVSLRAMMRKNSVQFAKLPNGTYGLAVWYPNAKKAKRPVVGAATYTGGDQDDDLEDDAEAPDAAPDEPGGEEAAA